MSAGSRPVPRLYWFITLTGAPTSITVYGEGNEMCVVFSSKEQARAYQQLLGLPSDWQLTHSNVAEHLISVCQVVRDDLGIEDILIDPPTDDSSPPQPRSPDNMIQLIDNAAVHAQEHGLGATSWPIA